MIPIACGHIVGRESPVIYSELVLSCVVSRPGLHLGHHAKYWGREWRLPNSHATLVKKTHARALSLSHLLLRQRQYAGHRPCTGVWQTCFLAQIAAPCRRASAHIAHIFGVPVLSKLLAACRDLSRLATHTLNFLQVLREPHCVHLLTCTEHVTQKEKQTLHLSCVSDM